MRISGCFVRLFAKCFEIIIQKYFSVKLIFNSLFYNEHLSFNYAFDTLMEPLFWFVDNFTHVLGPVSYFNQSFFIHSNRSFSFSFLLLLLLL